MKRHGVLVAIAIAGLAIRLVSLTGPHGPLDTPGGYDDSVYFSASALLFRGVLPYRDFVFVHPPGVAYFFGLISAWSLDPATAFGAARLFATLIGAINTLLVGVIGGPFAAVLYAIYPEAISAERGPYLECVLNLFCLTAALAWLRGKTTKSGVWIGAACATKVLGGIWFLAALVSRSAAAKPPPSTSRKDAMRFVLAAAITGIVLLAPLASWDVRAFIEQTVFFHSWRPPDGIAGTLPRLQEMLIGSHVIASALALFGIPRSRYFATVYILTIAALLMAPTYWPEYNAHLAASQCVLAGLGANALIARHRLFAPAIAMVIVVVSFNPMRQLVSNSKTRAPEIIAVGQTIREGIYEQDCVFAFDPSWAIAGGRLPPHGDGAPVIVDAYGAQLLAALRDGTRYRDAGAAFQAESSQRELRARLAKCEFVLAGARGEWQMNPQTKEWFARNFTCEPATLTLCAKMHAASTSSPP